MLKMYGYVCFLLLLLTAAVYTQSERCYFCNTETHGQACNDPIDPEQIQIQNCTDFEIEARESYFSPVWDFFKDHHVFSEKTYPSVRNTTGPVCINMTYVFNSRNVSVRGCESHLQIGELDTCEYYRQIAPTGLVYNFSCSICRGNLCNHANFIELVQTDGSEAIPISLKLMTIMLLAKMFFM